MKRRNVESGGKLRRPLKRNKITEGMYSSTTVLYMKFLMLWAIVITADFMFMFRFEFLWPFWLLLRSVHDSFKYKGLAFSVLFVCIAITSDLVCLFFIPMHWLLFAASTYVWVQYVWHTDKGICLPTIILWMLFVYLEAGIRWKDSRHMPHLDLCRPFAAHCIGYPVVTLGFGIKSYIGYRMRQRKQREVAKENEFYMQLLQQALPQENSLIDETQLQDKSLICHNNSNNNGVLLNASATTITNNSQNMTTTNTMGGNDGIVNNTVSTNITSSSLNNIASSISNSSTVSSFISALTTVSLSSLTSCTSVACSLPTTTATTTLTKTLAASTNVVANISSIFSSGTQNQTTNRHQTSDESSMPKESQTSSAVGNGDTALASANDLKNGVLSNGHITSNNKNNRRSLDKENKHKQTAVIVNNDENKEIKGNHNNNIGNANNFKQNILHSSLLDNNLEHKTTEWREKDLTTLQTNPSQVIKDRCDNRNANNYMKKQNSSALNSATSATTNNNNSVDGNDLPTITEIATESVERNKGRRLRSKKDNSSRENHNTSNTQQNKQESNTNNNNNNSSNHNNINNNNVQNSDASSVSSLASSSSNSSTFANMATSISNGIAASTGAATTGLTNLTSKVISKICETCLKLEADVKKHKSEISHMKQIENELRQKVENTSNLKANLQAKQKECDDLEKRIHELTSARNADMMQLQATERRLTEERRLKQSVDAQLVNEKKARKIAEEKAARPECSVQCKQRKLRMDDEIRQLRHELKQAEEAKQLAQEHGHKWEQELRMFEAEVRTRDSAKPRTEMLMNALAAMQDKNCTLEKNLSAETRVKLDLFSALGDAKRQLEISESRRISKEDEVLDLKAKIAQLLAVMPTDTLCLQHCGGTATSNLLRMNDTPPLQGVPASPILSNMVVPQAIINPVSVASRNAVSVSGGDYRQHNHNNNTPDYSVNNQHGHGLPQHSHGHQHQQQQQQQQQQQHQQQQQQQQQHGVGIVSGLGVTNASSLDPNACIYTPQNGPNSISPNGMGPEN